jgi:hypothetical protein
MISLSQISAIASAFVLFQSTALAAPDFAAKVQKSMELLKAKTAKLGTPRLEGEETVGDKKVPALFFGSTKINGNFAVVDELKNEMGGTATLFVKAKDEFVRVSTNVQKDDGTRAIGTILDPKGKAIVAIRKNESFFGEVDILGKPYTTGYSPIKDKDGNTIGVYYVGYLKLK